METETYTMKGVPDAEVPGLIADLRADKRYISHEVIPEGGGKNTVTAIFRKQSDPPARAKASGKKPAKRSRKKPT